MHFESVADFVNRVVLFAQLNGQLAGGRLLGLGLRATSGRDEEDRLGFTAEVMAKDIERIQRISKGTGHFFRRTALDEIGAKGFILALFGVLGFEEEAAD
jgi:hypothetical protein